MTFLKLKEKNHNVIMYLIEMIFIIIWPSLFIYGYLNAYSHNQVDFHPSVVGFLPLIILGFVYDLKKRWKRRKCQLVVNEHVVTLQRESYEDTINCCDIKEVLYYDEMTPKQHSWLFLLLKDDIVRPICLNSFSFDSKKINEFLRVMSMKFGITTSSTMSTIDVDHFFEISRKKPTEAYVMKNESSAFKYIFLVASVLFIICLFIDLVTSMAGFCIWLLCFVIVVFLSSGLIYESKKEKDIHLKMDSDAILTNDSVVMLEDIDSLVNESNLIFVHLKNVDDVIPIDMDHTELAEQVSYYSQRFLPITYK